MKETSLRSFSHVALEWASSKYFGNCSNKLSRIRSHIVHKVWLVEDCMLGIDSGVTLNAPRTLCESKNPLAILLTTSPDFLNNF